MQVVNFAYLRDAQQTFPWATLMLDRIHHTIELWQVSGVCAMRCIPAECSGKLPHPSAAASD
jgi:hypothetical protein